MYKTRIRKTMCKGLSFSTWNHITPLKKCLTSALKHPATDCFSCWEVRTLPTKKGFLTAFDGEAPVLEIWGVWRTPSLPFSGLFWPGEPIKYICLSIIRIRQDPVQKKKRKQKYSYSSQKCKYEYTMKAIP